MIKYRAMHPGSSMAIIESIEVIRETAKQVILAGYDCLERRKNKNSSWSCWFDTWEQAHDFLVSEAEKKVDDLKNKLQSAQESVEIAKNIKGAARG